MKGLFLSTTDRDFPEHPSSFAIWFQPILPKLADYYWDYVFISIPRTAPEHISDSYLALYSEVSQLPYIPRNTYLPQFADYVDDRSWRDFCGYLTLPDPAKLASSRSPFEGEEIDIAFQCMDGGPVWTVHSRDESILTTVVRHAIRLPGAVIEEDTWP